MVKISVVGDIFPSNTHYTEGFGNGNTFLTNLSQLWEKQLKQNFESLKSDIIFGNLEVPLICNDNIVQNSSFAGSTKFSRSLQNLGFNIVSIANNHILEQGEEGFKSTIKALEGSNVNYIGVFNDAKSNIVVIEKNNLRIGFAAFNAIKDLSNPSLYAELSIPNIKRTIDEMELLRIDYKLLSFHWGNEYINIPSSEQIELAHKIIDYGGDVIIGHHPHVVQPIERYKKGIIIYSLGNFIFDFLFSKQVKLGMLVSIHFEKGSEIEYEVTQVKLNNKNLNYLSNSRLINEKLNSYKIKMNRLNRSSQKVYDKIYFRELKKNTFYQRFLMKIQILKLFVISSHRKRVLKKLFNNVIKKYFH